MYQNGGALFFFFLEIENAFECSLLLASDFSIQVKVFGRVWWDSKFAVFLSALLLLLLYHLHLENFILSADYDPEHDVYISGWEQRLEAVRVLSPVWLLVTPWTVACQAPLSVEFSRQEYWSG